ncbi:MAG: PLP-dependent transferase, partial [Clostridiales bacterium]|nr:PLP-dependent transferase [Clostridiales bacterium]
MENYKFETMQIHAGQAADPVTGAVSVPIYQTSGYVFESCDYAASLFNLEREGNIYTRIMNPTNAVFEARIAALEGGTGALATASGQGAALITVFNLAKAGDHIICAKAIYGGTYNLFANTFKDYGIETTFVNADDPADFDRAVKGKTKLIFIEPVTNPNAGVVDVEAVA